MLSERLWQATIIQTERQFLLFIMQDRQWIVMGFIGDLLLKQSEDIVWQ